MIYILPRTVDVSFPCAKCKVGSSKNSALSKIKFCRP